MIKRIFNYTDLDGVDREEEAWFGLNKAEITEMMVSKTGGIENYLKKLINAKDQKRLLEAVKEIILTSYGEKSDDGRCFIKSEELSTRFSQTEAYSQLFMEIAFDDLKAIEFVHGILPADLNEKVKELEAEQGKIRANTIPSNSVATVE